MKYFILSLTAFVLAACGATSQADAPTMENSVAVLSALPRLKGDDNRWKMDRELSTLEFKAHHAGEDFTGNFSDFNVAISLNPDALETAQIHAAIALNSIDTKDDDRNANLPDRDWFDMASFPIAMFSSQNVTKASDGTYVAAGTLQIKGIEKPAELAFSLDIDGQSASAKGRVNFSRLDFNVGVGDDFKDESWVKFPIEVIVNIKANRL